MFVNNFMLNISLEKIMVGLLNEEICAISGGVYDNCPICDCTSDRAIAYSQGQLQGYNIGYGRGYKIGFGEGRCLGACEKPGLNISSAQCYAECQQSFINGVKAQDEADMVFALKIFGGGLLFFAVGVGITHLISRRSPTGRR
jgi:hypothetical protein